VTSLSYGITPSVLLVDLREQEAASILVDKMPALHRVGTHIHAGSHTRQPEHNCNSQATCGLQTNAWTTHCHAAATRVRATAQVIGVEAERGHLGAAVVVLGRLAERITAKVEHSRMLVQHAATQQADGMK
jgi:hypothetical protein